MSCSRLPSATLIWSAAYFQPESVETETPVCAERLTRVALVLASSKLSSVLERIAGDLDAAEDAGEARDVLAEARSALPAAFATYGRAVAENLAADTGAGRRRRRRSPG